MSTETKSTKTEQLLTLKAAFADARWFLEKTAHSMNLEEPTLSDTIAAAKELRQALAAYLNTVKK